MEVVSIKQENNTLKKKYIYYYFFFSLSSHIFYLPPISKIICLLEKTNKIIEKTYYLSFEGK